MVQENITSALKHLPPELASTVNYECSSIESYAAKYKDKVFDAVIMSEVIEHVENPDFFIQVASDLVKVSI